MIKISISGTPLLEQGTKCLVFFLEQDFSFSKELAECSECYFPGLEKFMKARKFTGAVGSSLLIPVPCDQEPFHLLFVGLGKPARGQKKIDVENFRRSLGVVIRKAEANDFSSIAFALPAKNLFGKTAEYLAKQVAIIINMASYQFDMYITDEKSKLRHDFDIELIVDKKDKVATVRGISEGENIAQAVNQARLWVDSPAADATPESLAKDAKKIGKKYGLKVSIFDKKKIESLGMGGLTAVGKGSENEPRLVIMEYTAKRKTAPTIGFVGKGITFDSGGLSLKPAAYMESMKEDMSGAAAVISAMQALAILKPSVNVVAVVPLAENMPSANAYRPGDILKFYNGKTAEILNTDAEGRLALADALAYITKNYKLDALVDVATLTGACLYALGPFFCGLMSQHQDLIKKVQKASDESGDRVWPLPFHDDFKPAIKSSVADISNTGSKRYCAGTTTAGFFLQNFVGETPWVHLDIAGTAFNVPDISYFRTGGTGFGVRLLVELAMNWK